jgi:hypothetical protein
MSFGRDASVSTPVKVRFALERDQYGWPPAESEGLCAEPVEGDLYRLDNTPWFARGVAADDVIQVEPDANGVLWFVQAPGARGQDRG